MNLKINNIVTPLMNCEGCGEFQPIRIDWMRQDTMFPHQGIWGDICCSKCFLVLNSIKVGEEGVYEFKKVSDIPPNPKEMNASATK